MKTQMNSLSLIAATVMLAVIFTAGVRERLVNIPQWFADPPSSFEIIRQQASSAAKFWIPVQIMFIIALITAFVTNWKCADVRFYLLLGTVCFLIVIILTATYYVREIMDFSKIPPTDEATPELLRRAELWYKTTVIRNILQGIALILFVISCIKSYRW
jgi:hypothetical protein